MPASWPTSIAIYTTKVDVTDVNYAAHINALQEEVIAIETNLGLGIKGVSADVTTRIGLIETGKSAVGHTHVVTEITDLVTTTALTSYPLKSIWSAKGVLIGCTAASVPTALAAPVNGYFLEGNTSASLGFQWGTPPIKHSVGTTVGDILISDGTNFTRLAVGATDGYALVVDLAQPLKIKWATVNPDLLQGFQSPNTLQVSTGHSRLRFPWAVTILGVAAVVNTAPTGASIKIDVNKIATPGSSSATTIFTTQANRPTIAIGAFDSGEMTPDVTSFAIGDELTVDIDQIGSTVAGSDLTVWVRYKRT